LEFKIGAQILAEAKEGSELELHLRIQGLGLIEHNRHRGC